MWKHVICFVLTLVAGTVDCVISESHLPLYKALEERKAYMERHNLLDKGIQDRSELSKINRRKKYKSQIINGYSGSEDSVLDKTHSLRRSKFFDECAQLDMCPYWDKCYDEDGCPDRVIPCRDCINPGQACHNQTVCTDPLQYCSGWYGEYFYQEDRSLLPEVHPCRSEACLQYTGLPECSDAVYEYCCDPSHPGCVQSSEVFEALKSYPCSAQGCSTFMESGYENDKEIDYSAVECPFSNENICGGKCEPLIFQLFSSYVFEDCRGECLRDLVSKHINSPEAELLVPDDPFFFYYYNNSSENKSSDVVADDLPTGTYCAESPFSDGVSACPIHASLYIHDLFSYAASPEDNSTVNDCIFEILEYGEELTCRAILSCMKYLDYVFGRHVNSEQNALCLGELSVCGGNYEDSPFLHKYMDSYLHETYRSILGLYFQCSGNVEEGFEAPDEGFVEGWEYGSECDQTKTGCGSGCCDLIESINAGAPTFTSPASPFFECSQLKSTRSIRLCLQKHCQMCYPFNTGPFGPDDSSGIRVAKSECVAQIANHCRNSTDQACIEPCPFVHCDSRRMDCPCDSSECGLVYSLPFEDRSKCKSIYSSILADFVEEGYFYPTNEWIRNELRLNNALFGEKGKDISQFTVSPVTDMRSLENGCDFLDEELGCFLTSASFCNEGNNFFSRQCRSLSTCGDGLVTWGEVCDDGNANAYDDGCINCEYVSEGYVCPFPGQPCQLCDYDRESIFDTSVCPFCQNERIEGVISPCRQQECHDVRDFYSAKACDLVVERYCSLLSAKQLYDPGCATYEAKAPKYGIPSILDSCTYDIKDVELYFKRVKGIKVAIIECDFIDQFGQYNDTTPLVPYYSLKHMLSEEDYQSLDTSVQLRLDILSKHGYEELIPITWLTDHELDFETDVDLASESGPLTWENKFRDMFKLVFDGGFNPFDEDSCYVHGEPVQILSPCLDPIQQYVRRFLKRAKFQASLWEVEEFSDFIKLPIQVLDDFTCKPKKNVIQVAIPLSTYAFEWVDGTEQKVERKQRYCTYNHYKEECASYEELLLRNKLKLHVGQDLYAPGCKAKDCSLKVAECSIFNLRKVRPNINLEKFDEISMEIGKSISQVGSSSSWEDVNLLMSQVAVSASSNAIEHAVKLFRSFIIPGSITKFQRDVENYCPYDYWIYNESSYTWDVSLEWKSDPCCNWELREYLCCAPKDIPSGRVFLVAGFKDDIIDAVCRNPAKIKSITQDMNQKLEKAQELKENIEQWTNTDQFENIWEFEETCLEAIESRNDECQVDADCFCSYSQCSSNWNGKKFCTTAERDLYKCFAQCFFDKYELENPMLLSNLQSHWNLDPLSSSIEEFEERWGEYMTEYGCAGPETWHPDIGYARYEWTCNNTCESEHTCDAYHGISAVAFLLNLDPEIAYELAWNLDLCASYAIYGFEKTCLYGFNGTCFYYGCHHPLMDNFTMPCAAQEECYRECDKRCSDEQYCVENNGVWMESVQACCPSHGFVHVEHSFWNEFGFTERCKYFPVGTPNSYEVRDETCCKANNGQWLANEWGGQCCFGKFVSSCDSKSCDTWCMDEIDIWEACMECHEECFSLGEDCRDCYKEREHCCSEQYIPQNKDACLSYMGCNDRSIYSEEECIDDEEDVAQNMTGWCGDNGWPSSSKAICEIYNFDDSCVAQGGEYDNNARCTKTGFPANGNLTECFPPGCPLLTWNMLYPSIEEPANGLFGSVSCDKGCYITGSGLNFEVVEYDNGRRPNCKVIYENGAKASRFYGRYYEDLDICQLYWTPDGVCEANLDGIYVDASYYYEYPRFLDSEQCEGGYCDGSINRGNRDDISKRWFGDQPWSEEQCLRLSKTACTKWCPYCQSQNWDIANQHGACFNETSEEMIADLTLEEDCIYEGYQWFNCPSPLTRRIDWSNLQTFCQTADLHTNISNSVDFKLADYKNPTDLSIPLAIFDALQCEAHFERCTTSEECENMGECHGSRYGWIDFTTQICEDPDWSHGDTHWGFKLIEVDNEDGTVHFFSEYESCDSSYARVIDGVCIAQRENGRCADYKWHSLGCKTDGYHIEDACVLAGHKWYDAPYTKAECLDVTGCFLEFQMRQLPKQECELCKGENRPYMRWSGGRVKQATIRQFQWHENREFKPVNEWIRTQASWKLQAELQIPILKTYTALKMTELEVQYNLYRNVLRAFACDCSGGSPVSDTCFASLSEGTSSGTIESYAGCDPQKEFGPGSIIQVAQRCEDDTVSLQRRLQEESNSSLTGSGPLTISFSYFSSGGFPVLEPCTGNSSTLIDSLAVKYQGLDLFVGQLLGDGIGISSDEKFGSISFCFTLREDIKIYSDYFDYLGVAHKSNDTIYLLDLDESSFSSKTMSKICVTLNETGQFFPVLSVSPMSIASNIEDINVSSCDTCSGHCVLTKNLSTTCVCGCGFSGDQCNEGCPNYCSFNGQCNELTQSCTCATDSYGDDLYLGSDCSRLNCPINVETSAVCSGHGSCFVNQTIDNSTYVACSCDVGYGGEACEVLQNITSYSAFNDGFNLSLTNFEAPNYSAIIPQLTLNNSNTTDKPLNNSVVSSIVPTYSDSTNAPSATPSVSPTKQPTRTYVEPEPIATLSIPITSEATNNTNMLLVLQQLQASMESTFGIDEDSNANSNNATEGTLTVEVSIEIEEKTSLSFSEEPSPSTKIVIIEATRALRCGKETPLDICNVKEFESNIGRLLVTEEFSLEIVVTETITDSNVVADINENNTERVSFTDSDFLSGLGTAINDVSETMNFNVTTVPLSVEVPVVETEAVVSIIYEASTAASAVSPEERIAEIQSEAQDTSSVSQSLDHVEGLTFGSIQVDLCEGRTCSSHGSCSEGICTCDLGYTGISCEFATDAPTKSPTSLPTTSPTMEPTSIPTTLPLENIVAPPVESPTTLSPTKSAAKRASMCIFSIIPVGMCAMILYLKQL